MGRSRLDRPISFVNKVFLCYHNKTYYLTTLFFYFSKFMSATWSALVTNLPIFRLSDLLDILIVSFLIYIIIAFIRQSRSYFIIYAVIFLFVISYLSTTLNLSLTRQIIQPLLTFLLFFLVIVFQKEIRRFFDWFWAHGRRLANQGRVLLTNDSTQIIADTVFEMARKKVGAIIVFPGDYALETVVEGGFNLDGRISRPLLLSIFDTSSPGHDGAIIIENNRIKKFGVHLPLAEKFTKFSSVGTRHRATAGVTQRTDAAAIVVSEERGEVSWSNGGDLEKLTTAEELQTRIASFLRVEQGPERHWYSFFITNWKTKLFSVLLALLFWIFFVYQTGVTNESFNIPVEFQYLPGNLVTEKISPTRVDVTLSGSYQDLHNLDTTKDLKILVDAKKFTAGWQRITLDESNVQSPSYLTLVDTVPNIIVVKVNEVTPAKDLDAPLGTTTSKDLF